MRLDLLPILHRSPGEQSPVRLTASQRRSLKWSRRVSHMMDQQWRLGPWHFGVEPVVDLIPILGDAVSGVASLYQLWLAFQLRLSRWNLIRMCANVGVDLGLGLIPFVGDFFDAMFKVHARNQRIIERHLEHTGFEGI